MKYPNLISSLLLLLMIGCHTHRSTKKSDVERLQLKGKVKSYVRIIHRNSGKLNDPRKTQLKEQFRELLKFDHSGRITEKVSFYDNGEPYTIWVSIYDDRGDKVEGFEIEYPNDTIQRWAAKFDTHRNEIESVVYDHKDSILGHYKSTYNAFNKEIELRILKSMNLSSPLLKVLYKYDKDGNRIQTTRIYADNSKTEWFTKYDAYGNETEWTVYDAMGNLDRIDSTNYIYYENGKIKEEREFSSVNFPEEYYFSKYDENGDEIESAEYFKDSIISKEVYLYNNDGSRTTEYYDSKGVLKKTKRFISEFDSHGNLVKESEYENGQLRALKEYRFTYYD